MRVETLSNKTVVLIRSWRNTRDLSLHNVRTQWERSHLQARKRALTRNQPWWHLDLGLQNCTKINLFSKLPSLSYFVMEALADQYTNYCVYMERGKLVLKVRRAARRWWQLEPGHYYWGWWGADPLAKLWRTAYRTWWWIGAGAWGE